ncbi:MAG: TonB-linked SusC/RagA family outer membrane protein [Spirosomataceae bacterium]|jgi:TonB-linked SusC/RagA family outer membrane protein
MKKVLLSCFMVLLTTFAFAQSQVSGTITAAEDGSALPGVSVRVKGTTKGTQTDAKGSYSIDVQKEDVLQFSFIGYILQEIKIGNQSVMNVALKGNAQALQEVVVTALGVSREKKSLGYSVQEIQAEKLTAARDPNIGNALAGKIAGVQILGQSAAKFGTPNIRIRGVNSLTGGDPLYVVDGTPVSSIADVNMDDVDNLSVLKGPSATALYGNRASGGVIVITTKRAKSGETSINFNHSSTIDMVALLPNYQNEYGGGYSQDWDTFSFNPAIHPAGWASFNGQRILDYSADESWGPKIDNQPHRSAASWQIGDGFGQLTPYSANPNNVRDFFETPISNNTNISIAKGGESFQSRISYTHIANNGIIPNSKQIKDFISAKNTINFNKKLSATLDINYTTAQVSNLPADNYGSSGGTTSLSNSNSTLGGYNQTIGSFNQWFQRQLSIEDLRNYQNTDGTFRSWNIGGPLDPKPKYWDSPYTQVYANTNSNKNDRVFGSFGFQYKIIEGLTASITSRRDLNDYYGEGRIASGTLNAGGKGAYSNYVAKSLENNNEFLLNYNSNFSKISVFANAGGNMRYNKSTILVQATNGGLTTPGFYNISASKDRPSVNNLLFERKVNSVFANASIGYDNTIFIEGSLRNDWSSTLPKSNNSYFYPSISTSIVFTEFLPANNVLSFGKIRGGYAQVGTDLGPYNTSLTYNTGNPYGSTPTQFIPSQLPNADLQPGLTSSYEGGIDLKFFKNRLSMEFTAYQNNSKNQIIPLAVAPTSGYSSALINAGLIQTKGVELHIGATPIIRGDFLWEVDLNLDRSNSKVITLAEGLTNYQLGSSWRGLTINAREGQDWGLFVGRKIRTLDGKRVVDKDGFYIYDENKELGSVLPKFKGGLLNSFSYKNFTLRANMDFVVGGKFFSVTKMFNAYAGLGAETAGLNELGNPKRDPVADGGGVILSDAVTEDGQPNTKRVDTQILNEERFFALHEKWIYDQTFVKLREVYLGYSIPKSYMSKLGVKSAKIGLIVRNPLLLYSAVGGGIDISEAESYWTEGGQLPPVRSYGINLNLGF